MLEKLNQEYYNNLKNSPKPNPNLNFDENEKKNLG